MPSVGSALFNDAPGFPISINHTGPYKLTSNLIVPAGLTGIVINAPGVTLDLNGYKIVGPGTCSRIDATYFVGCAPATLDACSTYGVQFLQGGGSTAASNGGHGFLLGRSLVQDSFAFQNKLQGFEGMAGNGAPGLVIRRNVSAQNKAADFQGVTSMGGNVSSAAASRAAGGPHVPDTSTPARFSRQVDGRRRGWVGADARCR